MTWKINYTISSNENTVRNEKSTPHFVVAIVIYAKFTNTRWHIDDFRALNLALFCPYLDNARSHSVYPHILIFSHNVGLIMDTGVCYFSSVMTFPAWDMNFTCTDHTYSRGARVAKVGKSAIYHSFYPRPYEYCHRLCLCVCMYLCVCHFLFVRAITHHTFQLESPNLDEKMKNVLLKVLIVLGAVWAWPSMSRSISFQNFVYLHHFGVFEIFVRRANTGLLNGSTSHMAPHTF